MSNELDTLIVSVSHRLGVGADKVREIANALVALIFDPRQDGLTGFLQRFQRHGMETLIHSWTGPGQNEPLEPNQVAKVFGSPLLDAVARKVQLPDWLTTSAIAGLLPSLVDQLTPGGVLPDVLPASFSRAVTNEWQDYLGRFDVRPDSRREVQHSGTKRRNWPSWLLAISLFCIGALLLRGCAGSDPASRRSGDPTATSATVPATEATPRFAFENQNGTAVVSGVMPSEEDRIKLLDALKATFGSAKVSGDIAVDTTVLPAGWLDKLIAQLPQLKTSGIKLGLAGDKLMVDSSALPEKERMALSQTLRAGFSGFEISGLWDKALAALAALKPGFTADELVSALNQCSINFESGSNGITRDSYETLQRAAEAIKAAPAGTRVEVGGHTDDTGDGATNTKVSLDRANAVMGKLVELGVSQDRLSGNGYGESAPIADNSTEEGRARNRRMEFKVLK